MAKGVSTVKRKIYFYRIMVRPDRQGHVPVFDPNESSAQISSLRFVKDNTGPESRYMATFESDCLAAWPSVSKLGVRVRIGKCRRSDLPHLEDAGRLSGLGIGSKALLDSTHMILFANGIVGAEFNFYGPRANRLCDYLAEKCPKLPRIRLNPLLQKSVREQIDHLEVIRAVRLRVYESEAELLEAAQSSLAGALESAGKQYGAGQVDVTLKPSEPRGALKISPTKAFLKSLTGKGGLDERDVVKVYGKDDRKEKVEWFDLLKDKFVFTENVVKEDVKHRAVVEADMFAKIEEAYNEHREALENAPAIGDED